MADKSPQELLLTKIRDGIESFDAKRSFNRSRALAVHIVLAVLGAGITVAIGWSLDPQRDSAFLKNTALIFGALVSVVGAYSAFSDFRGLWISYTEAATDLRRIRDTLEFESSAGSLPSDRLTELFGEFNAVMSRTNNRWQEIRQDCGESA